MGATRKHRNRRRNLTRGSQQHKLARAYVDREIAQQINAAFANAPQGESIPLNHLPFRCHSQFGWCRRTLLRMGYQIYQPPVGSYSRIGYIVPL